MANNQKAGLDPPYILLMKRLNRHTVEFIIVRSITRREIYPGVIPMDCLESIEIFDELDSLDLEELIAIYTVYLLGSGNKCCLSDAIAEARVTGFKAVEKIAFEPQIHDFLANGLTKIEKP